MTDPVEDLIGDGMAFVTVIGAVIGPVLAEADDPVGRWLRGGSHNRADSDRATVAPRT